MSSDLVSQFFVLFLFFFFNDTATTEIYTLSLHYALPISFPATGDGDFTVYDIIGNVWELCRDEWDNGYYERDRKSTRLNSSHTDISRMPSSA